MLQGFQTCGRLLVLDADDDLPWSHGEYPGGPLFCVHQGQQLEHTRPVGRHRFPSDKALNGFPRVLNELGQPLTDTTYRIPALSGSIHVEVTFREIATHTVDVNEDNTDTSFEVIPGSAAIGDEVMKGAAVVFTVAPESGYGIISVSVEGNSCPEEGFDSITREADGTWTCVVVAVTEDLVVTAEATQRYTITIPDLPVAGSIMISAEEAIEGTGVMFLVIPAGSTPGPVNVHVQVWSASDPNVEDMVGTRIVVGGLIYQVTITEVADDGGEGERIREFFEDLERTLSYVPGDVGDSDDLLIHVYGEDLGTWVPLAKEVNPLTGEVWTRVSHLSSFAVFEVPGRLTDIRGHWGEGDILRLTAVGAISGYPDGTFRPGNMVTREQFARMLVDAAGLTVPATARRIHTLFDDFDDISEWARPYVEAAVMAGLIMGFGDDTFRSLENVTRAQVAVMLCRALELVPAGTPPFDDAGQIPEWAAGHIAVLGSLDIVRGLPGNLFVPLRETTRAEAAAFLFEVPGGTPEIEKRDHRIGNRPRGRLHPGPVVSMVKKTPLPSTGTVRDAEMEGLQGDFLHLACSIQRCRSSRYETCDEPHQGPLAGRPVQYP